MIFETTFFKFQCTFEGNQFGGFAPCKRFRIFFERKRLVQHLNHVCFHFWTIRRLYKRKFPNFGTRLKRNRFGAVVAKGLVLLPRDKIQILKFWKTLERKRDGWRVTILWKLSGSNFSPTAPSRQLYYSRNQNFPSQQRILD